MPIAYMPCSGLLVVKAPLLNIATPNNVDVNAASANRRPDPSSAWLKTMVAVPLNIGASCIAQAGRPGIRPISLRCFDRE
ncbi:hypothetical protein [Stenotrophomonas maltophilia]|uniref:hypothetical protein n=1 Tax=Stenotrophomonas maltophilia TaxID=40324 RepID=UPI0015DCED94|nr:hypothetical protein [Stenotrophomonas maltophilia]QDL27579.1 hypothetical protein EGM71_07380 [Stenotrophomonas maltophilia]